LQPLKKDSYYYSESI